MTKHRHMIHAYLMRNLMQSLICLFRVVQFNAHFQKMLEKIK